MTHFLKKITANMLPRPQVLSYLLFDVLLHTLLVHLEPLDVRMLIAVLLQERVELEDVLFEGVVLNGKRFLKNKI